MKCKDWSPLTSLDDAWKLVEKLHSGNGMPGTISFAIWWNEKGWNLPDLKGHIRPLGGRSSSMGRVAFDWQVTASSRNLNRGQVFIGRGDNYNDAALCGIMTLYELVCGRRRGIVKKLGAPQPADGNVPWRQVKPRRMKSRQPGQRNRHARANRR